MNAAGKTLSTNKMKTVKMKWKDFQVPMTKEEHDVTCCNLRPCRIISCIRSPAGCQTEKYPGIFVSRRHAGRVWLVYRNDRCNQRLSDCTLKACIQWIQAYFLLLQMFVDTFDFALQRRFFITSVINADICRHSVQPFLERGFVNVLNDCE